MKSINPVKMLAALALVLLVFSATEGRILSKCELKKQLDAAQFQVITAMGEKISMSHLIARLVCKANSSAFNTSFVKAIMVNNKEKNPAQAPAGGTPRGPPQASAGGPPQASAGGTPRGPPQASAGGPPRGPPQAPAGGPPHAPAGGPPRGPPHAPAGGPPRGPPHAPAGGPPRGPPHAPAGVTPQGPPQAPVGVPPKPHTQAPTKGPHGSGHEATHPQLNATAKVFGQLYGMFQLSDQLACDSGMMPSLNVCNMSCSALIDDDITNDIACLKTLINSMKPKPKVKPTDVVKILEALMKEECRSVVPSKYFADCA